MGVGTATNADSCPVCTAPRGSVLYAEARDPITLGSFRVSECSVCRVAYTEPRPASLDRYYPQGYRGYGPLVTRILGAFYEMRVSRWARRKPGGGSVLEIGCGPGLMLAAFAQRGWKALGIERNEEAAQRARRTPGLEITANPVEELPADARFDLIVMFHVLEHIAEPVTLLRECAKRLALGGRLIVNVPNFSSWQSRFAGSSWLHLDVPRHLVHFSPQTFAATLARAGLKLTELRYASLEHDPYGWVESTLNCITGRPNTLTRFLMGIEPFGPTVVFSLLLGAILMPAALILALASWAAGRGALMEATATLSAEKAS
jgi:SAM-dependent methyltransferase